MDCCACKTFGPPPLGFGECPCDCHGGAHKWFVMLQSATGETPIPMVTLEDDVALFNSRDTANKAGHANPIGESFGFKIYEW